MSDLTFTLDGTAYELVPDSGAAEPAVEVTTPGRYRVQPVSGFPQYLLEDSGLYGPTSKDWNRELCLRWPAQLEVPSWKLGNWLDAQALAQGPTPYAVLSITAAGDASVEITALVQRWVTTGENRGIYLRAETSPFNAWAEVIGRLGAKPPRLDIQTTEGAFTLNGTLAGYATSSTTGTDTRLVAKLKRGFVGLLHFPKLGSVRGVVESATLTLRVAAVNPGYTLTLQIMETDPPKVVVGGDGGEVELGLAAEVGEDNLPAHPDVFKAGDFRKENWFTFVDSLGNLRADQNNPAPLSTFATAPVGQIPGYELDFIPDPHSPGKTAMRASFVYGLGRRDVDCPGPSMRGVHTVADASDAMYPIRADQLIEKMHVRATILLEDDFWTMRDGIKGGIGFDCRFGYWRRKVGYWQNTTGNSGSRGTGLKIMRSSVDDPGQMQWEYQGHSMRMHLDNCRKAGTPYDKYRPVLMMVSHLGPFDYALPYGTEEIRRCGTVVVEKGRPHDIEFSLEMNSVAGPFDAWGNGDAVRDGVMALWVDGVKRWEKTDFAFRRNAEMGIAGPWIVWLHGGVQPCLPGEIMHYQMNNWVCARRYIGPRG